MLPEDKAQSSLIFWHTHMSWCREECNAELEVAPWLLLKLGSTGTYFKISLSHDQNAYIVQYVEEGDFLVLLSGKDSLKSHLYSAFSVQNSILLCGSQGGCSWENVKHWVANPNGSKCGESGQIFSSHPSSTLQGPASLYNKVLSCTSGNVQLAE